MGVAIVDSYHAEDLDHGSAGAAVSMEQSAVRVERTFLLVDYVPVSKNYQIY